MLGARNYLYKNFYAVLESGVSMNGGALETDQLQFSAAAGAGYALPLNKYNALDISLRYFYTKYRVNNDTWVNLRIGYLLGV